MWASNVGEMTFESQVLVCVVTSGIEGNVCPKSGIEEGSLIGTHLQRLHSIIGIKDAIPVLLSLGRTSLLLGINRAEVLNPIHIPQLPSTSPIVMSVTGLEKELSLYDL